MLFELILKNRSYRRFHQDESISRETLRKLIGYARLSASLGNKQPLKYILSCDPNKNSLIFDCLSWAAYLKNWDGPEEGERPSAYIIILGDKEISDLFSVDTGIAAQSILLGATELGLGGCIIGSIQKPKLVQVLQLAERYEILYVLALGKPKEKVVIDPVPPCGDIRYWRDANGTHHVPKRALDDIILK